MSKAAKKSKPRPATRARGSRSLRTIIHVAGTLIVVGLVIVGLGRLGQEAKLNVGVHERYEAKFADIQCPVPPGSDRNQFLAEVRKASHFPETFQVLDVEATTKLGQAFREHPWVESVSGITVEPAGVVHVGLKFRTPSLAVPVRSWPPIVRLVDEHGVLLPVSPLPVGMAILVNYVSPPTVCDGGVWADETVKRALELAKSYKSRQLEKTTKGWRLTQPDGRVLIVGW